MSFTTVKAQCPGENSQPNRHLLIKMGPIERRRTAEMVTEEVAAPDLFLAKVVVVVLQGVMTRKKEEKMRAMNTT
jgi:hypothetical protein